MESKETKPDGVAIGAKDAKGEDNHLDPFDLVSRLRHSLKCHKQALWSTSKDCFVTRDAIDWLLETNEASTEEEAIALCNMLIECNLVVNVSHPGSPVLDPSCKCSFTGDPTHMSRETTTDSSSFWKHYASHIFGKKDAEEESFLPDIPWEQKQLHPGVEDIATSIPPIDENNVKLLDNVHPIPWDNPVPKPVYNLVVVGGGAAGLVSAIGSASVGAKVALIEGHLLGGDCTNFGCVPSKALIKSASVIHAARNGRDHGLEIRGGEGELMVNFEAIMTRMRAVRGKISEFEAAKRLRSLGIDVFIGKGEFDSPSSILVNEDRLHFRKCIICSGGKAYIPNLPGLLDIPYLTNESLFNLTELPRSLLIVGGGPIGIEMAQAFQRFGTEVTVLIRGKKILDKEDVESAIIVEESLKRDGVTIISSATNQRFERKLDGQIEVCYEEVQSRVSVSAQEESRRMKTIIVEKVLVATGRRANVNGFGLERANVRFTEQHGIEVDDFMKTSNPLIYAAGDCCSHYQFTHAADHMARICIVNALFYGKSKFSSLLIPWCTYTDPEIAHVGLYPRDMEERNVVYDTYKKEFSDNDRAVCEGSTEGFVKIYVKKGTDKILGATIVGEYAGDMISEICTLMNAKVGLAKVSSIIHPYPTRSDAIRQIGDEYDRVNMTPFTRRILKTLLSLGLR